MPKPTRLFFVRCNGDGSWLTQRRNAGGGHIFEHAPRDPMLVSGPVGEWQGAYELIPSPFTVETWPDFPVPTKEEEQIIRIYIEDGIVQDVTGMKAEGPLQTVRIIDLDVEGSDEEDRQELSADDRPAYKVDDEERANGPKPIEAFVTDWNDSGRIA